MVFSRGQIPNLSLKDRYDFCMAPANASDPRMAAALLQFATRYAANAMVDCLLAIPTKPPENVEELRHLEAAHQARSCMLASFVVSCRSC